MAQCGTWERKEAWLTPPPAEELFPGKPLLFTVEMYKPRGYDDVIISADKPEIPIAVHHCSISSDIEIPSYCGGRFLWIVLGIQEDIRDPFVWSE